MKNISLKVVKMGILSVSMASGLALAGGYDLEDYASSLTTYQVQDYSAEAVGFRSNNGFPPFDPLTDLQEIPDADLTAPNVNLLTDVQQSEIAGIVKNMRDRAKNNINAIGLHSGAVMFKNGNYQHREVYNMDGAYGNIFARTKNNMSWYPDDVDTVGIRLTTGDFNLGAMPLWGKARLDIPLAKIKKQGNRIWFIARANYKATPPTSDLDGKLNYYEVFGIRAPIIEFFGYYDLYDENTQQGGEWKIKFVINSDIVPDASAYGIIHPDLNFKVFAQGKALDK